MAAGLHPRHVASLTQEELALMLPVKHFCLEGGWPGWCYSFIGLTSSWLKHTLCGVVDIFFSHSKSFCITVEIYRF